MNLNAENKILIVDDAIRFRSRLDQFLISHKFSTIQLSSGKNIMEVIKKDQPNLILLDVMMPELDGFEVLRHIRQTSSIPIIMLTAANNKLDRINGLEDGADDYIGKPFHLGELLARIKAVLRRAKNNDVKPLDNEEILTSKHISLDIRHHCLNINRAGTISAKNLSNLEFKLFYLFISSNGEILSRDQILEHIFDNHDHAGSHSLTVYINRLRKILTDLGTDPKIINTIWGQGYNWNNI
ncbi:MAG: response regulator transcription factor [Deltaproteobacteria bacterium]|jgi:DNA-binding response OmpR family regulator|nr:response regulator transcription factor [Deltaproteobacteria bacterium]